MDINSISSSSWDEKQTVRRERGSTRADLTTCEFTLHFDVNLHIQSRINIIDSENITIIMLKSSLTIR